MYYVLSAILLWSTLGLVIRLSGEPIHLLILYSCALSALLIGHLFLGRRREGIPRGRTLILLVAIAPVSLVNTFSFFYAYRNTTIANAVLTHYTAPIIVALVAPIFLRERLTVRAAAAVAIACVLTKFATCPLPPKENYIKLRITAGEKVWGENH